MAEKKLPDLEWFRGRANYLEDQNTDRDKMFKALDAYRHGEWILDEELMEIDWIHESRDPIFAQQSDSAKHILSDVTPGISLLPYNPGGEGTDLADRHEKGLRWLLDSASRRRQATIVQDVVSSSVDYSEVTAAVMYIPQQIKDVAASGGNTQRYEAMLRRGPFAVIMHNPQTVRCRYSDLGPEEVVLDVEDDPHNIIDLYGTKADGLKNWVKDTEGKGPGNVRLKNYRSYDYRAVWVELGEGGEMIEILREKWMWPFLGWVCRYGGTSLEEKGHFQRKPLMANMYHFDLYDDINRVRTLRFSDMIRTASEPRDIFSSDTRTTPDIDASTGDLTLHIDTEEDLRDRAPRVPDPSMSELYAELRSDVQKSMLSELLLGGDVPAGAAFASIDLVTNSALKVLRSSQSLAQNSVADILETMLLYIHYDNSEVISYGTGKIDRGDEYLIRGEDIVPDNLYITVTLEADLPTDFQARTVTGRAQIDAGINSRLGVMEDTGIKNATEVEEEIVQERLAETMLAVELENIQFTNSVELQQQMQEAAMEQLRANPELLMQLLAELQAAQQPQGGQQNGAPVQEGIPGNQPRGVEEFLGDEIGPESLVPSEANAAEGGPTTEEFDPQGIRRAQQEGF